MAPVAECSGSLVACSSDQSCPVVDYMTCWEKHEAMSDDSYDSYEGVDGRPEYFDCNDPRDYDEWCAWNDVDEDEGCGRWGFFPETVPDVDLETVVVNSVVYEPSREEMLVSEGPDYNVDVGSEMPSPGLVDSLNMPGGRISLGLVLCSLHQCYHTRRTSRYQLGWLFPGQTRPSRCSGCC